MSKGIRLRMAALPGNVTTMMGERTIVVGRDFNTTMGQSGVVSAITYEDGVFHVVLGDGVYNVLVWPTGMIGIPPEKEKTDKEKPQ